MRTYGRVPVVKGGPAIKWVLVQTDPQGGNDGVYLTTICQVLKLSLNESPFFASYGIPAADSVIQQTNPDYNSSLTQQAFAPYFASLVISRTSSNNQGVTPTYQVNIMTSRGDRVITQVAQ